MDYFQEGSKSSTSLYSPPKRRIPKMTHEQIYDYLKNKELLRIWENIKNITSKDFSSYSKEGLELCLRKFKHYNKALIFNAQLYASFYESAEEEYEYSELVDDHYCLQDFLERQISLLQTYLHILGYTEKTEADEEDVQRTRDIIRKNLNLYNNLKY